MSAVAGRVADVPERADSLPIEFSEHAVERFERLRPDVEREAAYRGLCLMLSAATVTRTPPGWLPNAEPADRWLVLGDDFCCPLRWSRGRSELVAVTLLSRGALSAERRLARNAWRARRRAGKRGARRAKKYSPRERPAPDIEEWS